MSMKRVLTARSGLALELCFSMTAALQAKPLLLASALSSGTFLNTLATLSGFAEQQTVAEREARRL